MMGNDRDSIPLEYDNDRFTTLVREAVRQALEEHYRAGNPIVIWHDDRMMTVPSEEIPALLLDAYGYDVHADAPAERADAPIPAPNR